MRARPPEYLIYALTISGMLANPLITANLTEVVAEFGRPDSKSSLLVAVVPLPGIFLALLIGMLADRFGRRLITVICLTIFGFAGLASSVAPTFEILLFTRFMQGIGSAGLLNLPIVLIADHWQEPRRTEIMGRNSAALAIGLVAIPPLSGFLAELASWRWSLAVATIAIPLAVITARALPEDIRSEYICLNEYYESVKASLRLPIVLATLCTGFALFAVIFGVFTTVLPIHLDKEFGLEAGARGSVIAASAITSIIASLYLVRISNLSSKKRIIVFSGILISFAAFGIGAANSIWIVIAACLIYGFGDGILIPTLQGLAATSVPASQRAAVLALWTSFVRLGQLVGPLVAGLLMSIVATEIVIFIGALGFGVVSLWWLRSSLEFS